MNSVKIIPNFESLIDNSRIDGEYGEYGDLRFDRNKNEIILEVTIFLGPFSNKISSCGDFPF